MPILCIVIYMLFNHFKYLANFGPWRNAKILFRADDGLLHQQVIYNTYQISIAERITSVTQTFYFISRKKALSVARAAHAAR